MAISTSSTGSSLRGRLVSVCGPGGMGKTRLVTEFGLRAAERWADGVWMVELASIAAGQPVGAAVARALGVTIADDDANGAIVEHLRTRRTLVILDNCEHVLDTVRPLVRLVLSSCPDVAVLATTRERLAVRGEQVHTLAPLVLTDDSVDLFVERARDRGHFGRRRGPWRADRDLPTARRHAARDRARRGADQRAHR